MRIIFRFFILLTFLGLNSYAQVSVYAKVDHIIPDGVDTLGNITLTVTGSTSPYTYTWNPGAVNTKDLSNITAGQYTVNVKSASSQTYTNSYKLGYKVLWTNLSRSIFRNDSLFNSTASTTIYCSAVSKNTLASGTNGWFEYVINSLSPHNHYIGFTDSISPNFGVFADIDYGFYYSAAGQDLYAVHTGTSSTLINSGLKVGDVVRAERNGDVIKYLINNIAVKTITVTGISSKALKLKTTFLGTNKMNNVGCSFSNLSNSTVPNYVMVNPFIKHVSATGATDGSIKVAAFLPFTNSYTWSPGGATTNSITSLGYGTYSLTVTDSLNNSSSYKYEVLNKMQWTQIYRFSFRNDSLISNNIASRIGSAVSKNTLRPYVNGKFQFVIDHLPGDDIYIGLLDSISPIYENADVDYGFYWDASIKYLFYYENISGANAISYHLKVGDVISVERTGDVITYRINNAAVRSITVAGVSAKSLKVKTTMYSSNYLTHIGASFNETDSTSFINYVKLSPYVKHSSGPGISDGTIKVTPDIPFANTYSWTPGGATTNSVTGLGFGSYKVTVKDSLLNKSDFNFNVGYKVNWTNLDRAVFRNDSLLTSGTSSQHSRAVSKNVLKAGEDGWVEFVLGSSYPADFRIGFVDSLSSLSGVQSVGALDYSLYYYKGALGLYSYESGSAAILSLALKAGDVIRLERVGSSIRYKLNGKALRIITNASYASKDLRLQANTLGSVVLANVGCSFYDNDSTSMPNYVEVVPLIKHATGSGINNGSISVKPRTSGLKSYSWTPVASTGSVVASLGTGNYTVIVEDSLANKSTCNYNVGYKAIWTNMAAGFFRNDTLKATATTTTYNYANTRNVLSANQDGWFEYVIPALFAYAEYIGFVDSAAANPSVVTDIQYGVYYASTKVLQSYELGILSTIDATPRAGDVVRIERVGNTIRYKLNGVTVRTVTNAAIGAKVFKLKAKLQYNTYLTNVGCSFPGCFMTVNAGPDHIIVPPATATLGGSPTASGVPSSFSYTWTPSGGLSSTTIANPVANPGSTTTYTVTVNNYDGCTASDEVDVFVRQNEDYVKLYSSLDAGYYTLPSNNKLYFTVDGEYEQTGLNFTVYRNSSRTPLTGLSASSSLLNYADNRYYIDMSSLASDYYILEVVNQKNEKLYLRFKR